MEEGASSLRLRQGDGDPLPLWIGGRRWDEKALDLPLHGPIFVGAYDAWPAPQGPAFQLQIQSEGILGHRGNRTNAAQR